MAGSESEDRDMAAYIQAADAIRNAFGCGLKSEIRAGFRDKARGRGASFGLIRAIFRSCPAREAPHQGDAALKGQICCPPRFRSRDANSFFGEGGSCDVVLP